MSIAALDARLVSVGKFVRQGAQFADIGTDHAYLPLALLSEGRIARAVCSDINEGPLQSARENAREAGFYDKMTFYLTDGAAALSSEGLTDIAIAGMGGELIADIIEKAPFLRKRELRLILQPMSRQGYLREYLANAGFEILEEDYSCSSGKYYVAFCVQYTANARTLSLTERELGDERFLLPMTEQARGYLTVKRSILQKIRDGKIQGGECASDEEKLLAYINSLFTEDSKNDR